MLTSTSGGEEDRDNDNDGDCCARRWRWQEDATLESNLTGNGDNNNYCTQVLAAGMTRTTTTIAKAVTAGGCVVDAQH